MLILKNYTIKKKIKFRFCIKILGFILLIWLYLCHNNVNYIKNEHKIDHKIETEGRLSGKSLLRINDARQASTTARLWRSMTEASEYSKIGYKQNSQNENQNDSHDRVHENKSDNNENSVTLKKEEYKLKNELVEKNTLDNGESHKRKKKEKFFMLEILEVVDSFFENIVFSPFDAIKNYCDSRSSNKKNLRKKAYTKMCALVAVPILSLSLSIIIGLIKTYTALNLCVYIMLLSISVVMILYIFIKFIIYAFFVKRDLKSNK
ncbi:hypothetical protein PVMG_06076 [Plasmodium vivax Mauritania I]|uniref:Uncharacterized protein n=1 Tax=Plasmodium vivax Mauritania I TaxID=1035515 RepID=A0A0J9T3E1_PLAVI|nr:hypothetical protein PVMG_06076 [Plasmodium vivax Mauritania I]